MARLLALQSSGWLDLPLDDLAAQANEWGYGALELACAGEHFSPGRADSQPDYLPRLLETLEKNELRLTALSVHGLGQVLGDELDARHAQLVPDYVWGDGEPAGVKSRAAAELGSVFQAAQKLGVTLIVGSMGSPLTRYLLQDPPAAPQLLREATQRWAETWRPLLEAAGRLGLRFALEARPSQMAYDVITAQHLLRAVEGAEELGFAFCPAHFQWQGVDPCEFLRAFPERIFQVTLADAAVTLSGRASILGSHLPPGDGRRGWSPRTVGRGGVDWEAVVRTLNEIGSQAAWSVGVADPGMERGYAAAEAVHFARRLDFPPAETALDDGPAL